MAVVADYRYASWRRSSRRAAARPGAPPLVVRARRRRGPAQPRGGHPLGPRARGARRGDPAGPGGGGDRRPWPRRRPGPSSAARGPGGERGQDPRGAEGGGRLVGGRWPRTGSAAARARSTSRARPRSCSAARGRGSGRSSGGPATSRRASPWRGELESLSVSAAAAIALYEVARQRGTGAAGQSSRIRPSESPVDKTRRLVLKTPLHLGAAVVCPAPEAADLTGRISLA